MIIPNYRGPLFKLSPLPHSMGLVNDVYTPIVEPIADQIAHTTAMKKMGLEGLGCVGGCMAGCTSCPGLGSGEELLNSAKSGFSQLANAGLVITILTPIAALLLLKYLKVRL